jgi:glucans biosynthesis protein
MTQGQRFSRPLFARPQSPAILACFVAILTLTPVAASPASAADTNANADGPFGFEHVKAEARKLAAKPFDDNAIHLEDWLRQFDYDEYREIEFRRDRSIWHDTPIPYRVQFFHRGGIFPNPVRHYMIRNGRSEPLRFSTDLFNYRALEIQGEVPDDLGFAGFKLLYPLNDPQRFDELLSFIGSAYFRALGRGNIYGLSARGLAINTSNFGHEEFPWFRAFWIEEPTSAADANIRVYALLDSQSLTGAYEFVVKPGDPTVLEVQATLFTRKDIEELGVAPLTSMYLHGWHTPAAAGADFRPLVHDSDGLAIHFNDGERLWRPLQNPPTTEVTKFRADAPRGFGLLQRERNFDHYQDLEAIYQLRPSLWIEPIAGFGAGSIRLVEIAHDSEANDSIAAYWSPDVPVKAGQELNFAYRMSWGGEVLDSHGGGRVVATRPSIGPYGGTRFVIEFAGPALEALPPDAPVSAVVSADNGTVGPAVVQKNPFTNTWRVFFDAHANGEDPVTLRAFLKVGEDTASETWSFRCHP